MDKWDEALKCISEIGFLIIVCVTPVIWLASTLTARFGSIYKAPFSMQLLVSLLFLLPITIYVTFRAWFAKKLSRRIHNC
jgi:hypothetical protein